MQDQDIWERLGDLFDAAVDLPAPEQAKFLDQACAGDLELRRELELMLSGATPSLIASTVEEAAAHLTQNDLPDPLLGSWLGPYRVTALIGRGGMGAVYRAIREDDEFRKEVAIKVVPKVLAGPQAIQRFRSERQILANLEHPNIARLIDGGTSEGIPFLVMEYIDGGVPITKYAQERNLSPEDRLKLMQAVCSAVQYAHGNLIVHRDLKPANILVASDGTVKLLDFGVAKLLDPSAADVTQAATMLMTPDYASPEQIRGEPATTSTDIYSLGVVLYELLTGDRPYRITANSPVEMERAICQTQPRLPSNVPLLTRKQQRNLMGDIDNIVLMAMRKDAARRYQSAQHLSDDIQRFLDGEPVRARPDSLVYRTTKFLTRNRWPVTAGLTMALALIVASVISIRQANAARHRFDQLRGFAQSVLVDLHGELADIPGSTRARAALVAHVNEYLQRIVASDPEDDASLASEIATTYLRMGELQGTTKEALASFENARKQLERKQAMHQTTQADKFLMARIHFRTGYTLTELNRLSEGVENLQAAADMLRPLLTKTSDLEALRIYTRANWRMARIYRIQFKLTDAERYARDAIDPILALGPKGEADHELSEILFGARLVLAGVLRRQGHFQESLDIYLFNVGQAQRNAASQPGATSRQRDLARAHLLAADMLARVRNRYADVRSHLSEAIRIAEKLAAADPHDRQLQSDLGSYLSTWAEDLTAPEDLQISINNARRALAIFERLLEFEPQNGQYLLYVGLTQSDLGHLMGLQKPSEQSTKHLRDGVRTLEKLVRESSADITNWMELLKVRRMLAYNLASRGLADEAIRVIQQHVEESRNIVRQSAASVEYPKRELARAYGAVGRVYELLHRPEDARRGYLQALTAWAAWRKEGFHMPDADQEVEKVQKALDALGQPVQN
ncbi:hypothetical protein F183_A13590 [Bryobacterales bacterium F-183]|nr:hypothetical protein F183_A13590 [Bryobacterales bacterium F-183]